MKTVLGWGITPVMNRVTSMENPSTHGALWAGVSASKAVFW